MNKLLTLCAVVLLTMALQAKEEIAILAGGCFWCLQDTYDKLDGVIETEVGFAGGLAKNPTYNQVSRGGTGHYEAVKILFNSQKITFEKILDEFWKNIDPFNSKGQFCDKGNQDRAAIFYLNDSQKNIAKISKQNIEKKLKAYFSDTIVTELIKQEAADFYPADDYHQKYYAKNPLRYKFYRFTCGRDRRLKDIWGKLEDN